MKREIGFIGTFSRIVFGLALFGSVVYGHWRGTFRSLPWLIGLVVFPILFIMWHTWQINNNRVEFRKTGPITMCINILIFAVFYFTYWYAPAVKFMSDAVLIFYGFSMLLAAVRGYSGCEVLAISNWLLLRNDQIGCLVFKPFDALDKIVSGDRRESRYRKIKENEGEQQHVS